MRTYINETDFASFSSSSSSSTAVAFTSNSLLLLSPIDRINEVSDWLTHRQRQAKVVGFFFCYYFYICANNDSYFVILEPRWFKYMFDLCHFSWCEYSDLYNNHHKSVARLKSISNTSKIECMKVNYLIFLPLSLSPSFILIEREMKEKTFFDKYTLSFLFFVHLMT